MPPALVTRANPTNESTHSRQVNEFIRRDDPEVIIHVVMFARMVNTMLVTQRSSVGGSIEGRRVRHSREHWCLRCNVGDDTVACAFVCLSQSSGFPPKGTTWRGTGFDDVRECGHMHTHALSQILTNTHSHPQAHTHTHTHTHRNYTHCGLTAILGHISMCCGAHTPFILTLTLTLFLYPFPRCRRTSRSLTNT